METGQSRAVTSVWNMADSQNRHIALGKVWPPASDVQARSLAEETICFVLMFLDVSLHRYEQTAGIYDNNA